MTRIRSLLTWGSVTAIGGIPLVLAAFSPLLAWRDFIYITAGFAGIIAMIFLFVQPLLAGQLLPSISKRKSRSLHSAAGVLLLAAIIIHVAGLWMTSPPDVIDALLFRSPTQFSVWGVLAMWTALIAALTVGLRRRMQLSRRFWHTAHMLLVSVTVIGSVVHAMLIEGTMETISKTVLCVLVLLVTAKTIFSKFRKEQRLRK